MAGLTGKILGFVSIWAIAAFPSALYAESAPSTGSTQPSQPGSTVDQARQFLKQGAEDFRAGQAKTALEKWNQALELFRQAGDRAGEARTLGNLGAAAGALGDFQQAIAFYQQSLDLSRQLNDVQGIGYALGNLGFTYQELGDFQQAIAYHKQDLALATQRSDRAAEHYAANNLGIAYKALGDYRQAIEMFQRSLQLAQALSDRAGEANSLGNLGNVYAEQGNYPKALTTYEKTLALMQTLNNRRGQGIVLERLGNVYLGLGNFERANGYYQQGLAVVRAAGDRSREASILGNLGILARNQGDLVQATRFLQQALNLFQQLGLRQQESTAFNSLGNVYTQNGAYTKAEDHYRQSFELAQKLGDRRQQGYALGNLGQINDLLNRKPKAAQFLQQSIAIARELGDRIMEGNALHNLGIVQFESGDAEAAAKTLLDAIQIWESLRPGLTDENQISLFETQAKTYQLLQYVLIYLRRSNDALEIAERGRARAFIELIGSRLQKEAKNDSNLNQHLLAKPITLAQIQEVSKTQNATLVEYSLISPSNLAIWVVQPTGKVTFRQTTLQKLDTSLEQAAEKSRVAAALGMNVRSNVRSPDLEMPQLVQQTRNAIQATDATATEPVSTPAASSTSKRRLNRRLRDLHQILIEPIADLLPTNPTERVIFVPQGALFLVPFAALQDADRQYLIEKHTLLTAPAIQVLQLTGKKRQQQSVASAPVPLIVGNPTMPAFGNPPTPLSTLPNAEAEAIAIANLFRTQAILGKEATEDFVVKQMPRSRIIHLATHGLLEDFSGLGSPGAIALAPTPDTDGFLTANEILNLSLNADLVVLSACDTGRGRITGDGVVGLSRSLISAGATRVVVSLWPVPDDSTAVLMTEFYRQILKNPDQAQALRQAMLTTMKQYPNLRDWAAFTLIGDP